MSEVKTPLYLVHANWIDEDGKMHDENIGIFSGVRLALEAIYKDMREQEERYYDSSVKPLRDVEIEDASYDRIDRVFYWDAIKPGYSWDHILQIGDTLKFAYEVLNYELDEYIELG